MSKLEKFDIQAHFSERLRRIAYPPAPEKKTFGTRVDPPQAHPTRPDQFGISTYRFHTGKQWWEW